MRIEFDPSALVGGDDAAEIVAIAALCTLPGSPHRLVTDSNALRDWAVQQLPTLAEWFLAVAESGRDAEDGAGRSMRSTLTVVARSQARDRWRRPSPDALALLRRPFRIVLENSLADRAFLLAFASAGVHSQMIRWEQEGWLELHGVGGDDQVVKVAESTRAHPDTALRHAFLIDSDARELGATSERTRKLSEAISAIATSLGVPTASVGHVLRARSIENYAPKRSLSKFETERHPNPSVASTIINGVRSGSPVQLHAKHDERVAFAAAWSQLQWHVRSYLDVKRGLEPDRNAIAIVEEVPEGLRSALKTGLGRDFAADFYSKHIALCHETPEIIDMLDSFLSRL